MRREPLKKILVAAVKAVIKCALPLRFRGSKSILIESDLTMKVRASRSHTPNSDSRTLSRKFSSLRFCLILFLCLVCLSHALLSPARAQDLDDVSFNGQVTDQNGAVVAGATIVAVQNETKKERTVQTDAEGRFRLVDLEPGTYTVRAAFQNFATEERTEIGTLAGQNVRLDFVLLPASLVAEQVVVTEADAPIVDTSRTVVGGTITREEIEELPNNARSPLDLIFTLGGVTEEALSTRDLAEERSRGVRDTNAPANTPEESGSFALSGSPASSNNITIDGLDNNDDRSARERFQPSIEAVAEVQVITNQFSAEYGRASGGRINIRTSGGSNRFRGRAFYFFRDESLNANTFRNNSLGLKRVPFQEQNPGFTLSGPVRIPRFFLNPFEYDGRDRTFFFTAYEYNTILDTALIDTAVPVAQNPLFPIAQPTDPNTVRRETIASGSNAVATDIASFVASVSTPSRTNTFTARVDHKFSEDHNGTFLYQLGRSENLRQFGGGNRLAEALTGRTRNSDALSYSDNFVFSPNFVNQVRTQISRLTPAVEAQGGRNPVVLISIRDLVQFFPRDDPDQSLTRSLVAGSSTSGASDRRESRFQLQDAATYIRGSHTFKFGGDYQRIRSTFIDLSDISGTYNFASAGDFLINTPNRFRQNFQAESEQTNNYLGIFFQDEWRVRPNIVLSYGLRYETESILKDRNNFGPRAAIAYDPFGTGKTVIRAGAGIFYNRVLLRTIDDFTLGSQQLFFDTDQILNPDGTRLSDLQRRDFIRQNIVFPNRLSADSALVQQFAVRNTDFFRRLDPDIRIPESYQTNIGFERDIGKSFAFEANYSYTRGIHLFREFNANAPVLPNGFTDLSQYLLSRDFANFRSASGARPVYDVSTAGELVRFAIAPTGANPNTVTRIVESGVPISVINLNAINSTTAQGSALRAINFLRPDPTREQVEQLASIGNSFYHGLTLELRRRFRRTASGLGFSFRAAYTLSRLIDDGIVNTSSALVAGDFRRERSRSLLDRRHRFVLSGTFDTPRVLGKLRFSPILRLASGAPFNISLGGDDVNLDDVGNDRPNFNGDLNLLRFRERGEPLDPAILAAFSLPLIGQAGNLPRNAGQGPGQFLFDLSITREFRLNERMRLRPVIEFGNVFNATVFSFGSEFINFDSFSPTASEDSRQAFTDRFLVPTRTLRPRSIRLGLRFDF